MEVVDFFRTPEKFKASGARAPKGVLLVREGPFGPRPGVPRLGCGFGT
jgi:ATP-dependent Zn protease